MTQPTLAHVPGILLRTCLRLVGRVLFMLASLFLLIGFGVALCGILVATWKTPRGRRVQLAVDIVLLATELAKDYKRQTPPAESD